MKTRLPGFWWSRPNSVSSIGLLRLEPSLPQLRHVTCVTQAPTFAGRARGTEHMNRANDDIVAHTQSTSEEFAGVSLSREQAREFTVSIGEFFTFLGCDIRAA